MSKVSPNNDAALPSFEPIERKPSTKRRRALSKNVNQPDLPSKRPKAKKNTELKEQEQESSIWIGAKIVEEEKDDSDKIAAFSVYYGVDDSRNLVQKLSMKETDDLEYVYIKGVLHAIETCTDDMSKLSIHTGSKAIENALTTSEDVPEYNELFNQIKEKISNRKGVTIISYTEEVEKPEGKDADNNYHAAHSLAKEFLEVVPDDEDKEMTPVEDDVVECLDVTFKNPIDEGVSVDAKEEEKEEAVKEVEITTVTTTTITTETTVTKEVDAESVNEQQKRASWTNFGIRNIIDIFKSPFNRNRQ